MSRKFEFVLKENIILYRGVEQLVARRAHNPKVAGSSPVPATTEKADYFLIGFFCLTQEFNCFGGNGG